MKTSDGTLEARASTVGAWLFIAWAIILGPVGFLLLLGILYAMLVQNLALGIVCGLGLLAPLALTAIWLPVAGAAIIRERFVRTGSRVPVTEPVED